MPLLQIEAQKRKCLSFGRRGVAGVTKLLCWALARGAAPAPALCKRHLPEIVQPCWTQELSPDLSPERPCWTGQWTLTEPLPQPGTLFKLILPRRLSLALGKAVCEISGGCNFSCIVPTHRRKGSFRLEKRKSTTFDNQQN